MKIKSLLIPALLGLTICACATVPRKVPVAGNTAALAGKWEGEFRSADGMRAGSIMFTLRAGQDSAYGDVLMVPNEWSRQHNPQEGRAESPHPHPELLAISFVRVFGNHVRGTLEPYRDPVCGCALNTVFEGELKGDVINGTYRSLHVDTRETRNGTWLVRRSGTYADARVDRNHAVGEAK
ncbi:MAG TPA: hypothetical protein VGC44_10330 [Longimicrobiales bacterium]